MIGRSFFQMNSKMRDCLNQFFKNLENYFFQTDSIFYLKSPGRYLDDIGNWSLTLLDKTSFWPNNPDFLPSEEWAWRINSLHETVSNPINWISFAESAVGFEGIVATSGFLVPTKTKGKLQLFDMNAEDPNSTQINIASSDVRFPTDLIKLKQI